MWKFSGILRWKFVNVFTNLNSSEIWYLVKKIAVTVTFPVFLLQCAATIYWLWYLILVFEIHPYSIIDSVHARYSAPLLSLVSILHVPYMYFQVEWTLFPSLQQSSFLYWHYLIYLDIYSVHILLKSSCYFPFFLILLTY